MDNFTLYNDDCLIVLKTLSDNSIDSIVTDPPYGLSFMGKKWDYDVPSVEIWRECFRVLKPGGHLLSFAGTRTQHRMAVRIEDAGFEIRDMIAWIHARGVPKSLDISKAIVKTNGAEREVIGKETWNASVNHFVPGANHSYRMHLDITEAAKQWDGWGTALKPALEPITLARKPFKGTVADNVLKWGVGGLNIDGCRIGTELRTCKGMSVNKPDVGTFRDDNWVPKDIENSATGRWPANLIHDGSEEVLDLFPETKSGVSNGNAKVGESGNITPMRRCNLISRNDTRNAARFFYCVKASTRDRDEGLDGFTPKKINEGSKVDADNAYQRGAKLRFNNHPTVKPTTLMQYLCRLVTPPNGLILDPFTGSGSTGKAAMLEGFRFVGIEREKEYYEIAKARIEKAEKSIPQDLTKFFND